MSKQQCPNCKKEFISVGSHYSQSKCGYPDISDRQEEVCIGMLMGDAYINEHSDSGNSMLRTKMINKEFLDWLSDELLEISSNLELVMTASESFDDASSRFENSVTCSDNYSDIYEYRTIRHPYFNELREWYSCGKKRFPDNLELTPLIAKLWYVCDGSWDNRVSIYSDNESSRPEYLKSLFKNWDVKWQDSSNAIRFTRSDSDDFLSWIGEPVPGFEYKWGQ